MPDISLIGKGLSPYAKALRVRGHTVRASSTTSTFLSSKSRPDILVINASHAGGLRELKSAARKLPKIIVALGESRANYTKWLREPAAYPMHNPSVEDLCTLLERLVKEAGEASGAREMRKTLETLRSELDFLEQMSQAMAHSSEVSDILPAIMSEATRITGAESWSVHLIDPETSELAQVKTSGRLISSCSSTISAMSSLCARKATPVVVPDISKDRTFGRKSPASCRSRKVSIIASPIIGKNSVIGSLELLKSSTPFNSEDVDLLGKLAGRASLNIERILLQQRLEELVVTDDLTSLFNNRYLTRSVENEVLRSRRYGLSVSVIFMDVDHFKDVNDNHGHLVGSKVLVETGEILIRELRNIDIVARYGGDEFVIVLPQTSLANAMAIAERIRDSIERNRFLSAEGLNLRLTASFGVAAYPETSNNKEDLMRIADESMYNVKKRTRNGVYAIINDGTV